MTSIETLTAIGTLIAVLGSLVDLLNKTIRGKPVFNRTTLFILSYVATLGVGLIVGRVSTGHYADQAKEIAGAQSRVWALERTIDYLKGKTGKLNQQIIDYERRLNIPPTARIILFDHIDYNGHRCYITLGDDVSDLSLYGFGNTVSSIKVEGDIRAKIYNGINYTGAPLLIDSDRASLVEDAWNDRILSIDIKPRGTN